MWGTRYHRIVHFKMVHFLLCDFCLCIKKKVLSQKRIFFKAQMHPHPHMEGSQREAHEQTRQGCL